MAHPRYEYVVALDEPPEQIRGAWLADVSGGLNTVGYEATLQTEGGITYQRRYSPAYFVFLYIILFPVGLLLMLARPTQTITLTYVPNSEGGTNLTVAGTDPRLRSTFEEFGATDQLATRIYPARRAGGRGPGHTGDTSAE